MEPTEQEMRDAVLRVGNDFHTTRLSREVMVDPEDLYLVLHKAGYYPSTRKQQD